MESRDTYQSDRWALNTARSLTLAHQVSSVLFLGAVGAVLLGAIAGVSTFVSLSDASSGLDNSGSLVPQTRAIAQSARDLLAATLPAGLLAAAGAALRVQIARLETELTGS